MHYQVQNNVYAWLLAFSEQREIHLWRQIEIQARKRLEYPRMQVAFCRDTNDKEMRLWNEADSRYEQTSHLNGF